MGRLFPYLPSNMLHFTATVALRVESSMRKMENLALLAKIEVFKTYYDKEMIYNETLYRT